MKRWILRIICWKFGHEYELWLSTKFITTYKCKRCEHEYYE